MVDFASLAGVGGKNEQLVFRNFSVYTQGAKWGLARKAMLDLSMLEGQSFYDRGQYIGSSFGPIKSTLSIEGFVPTVGRRYQEQIFEALQQGKYVFVTVGQVGKKILQPGYMTVKGVKIEGDMGRGSCTIDVNFEGGPADILESTNALPLRLGGF